MWYLKIILNRTDIKRMQIYIIKYVIENVQVYVEYSYV